MAKQPAMETETVTEAPAVAPVQAPTLDLRDLGLVLNLINVTVKRGTFETHELREVLDLYDKLERFLKFQAQMQAAAQKGETNGGA